MSDQQKLKETLSALLDGEAGKVDQLELRRLARALEENPDLIHTWYRYTLASATLKGEHFPLSPTDFHLRVSHAIAGEQMDEAASMPAPSAVSASQAWLRGGGRVAIAAAVAVLAIYLLPLQKSAVATAAKADVAQAESVATQLAEAPTAQAMTRNNRVLDPDVLSVSAGDRPQDTRSEQPVVAGDCRISAVKTDNAALLWEKELPTGYAVCKQNEQTKQCETVSSRIGCYLD